MSLYKKVLDRAASGRGLPSTKGWSLNAELIKKKRVSAKKVVTSLENQLDDMKMFLDEETLKPISDALELLKDYSKALEIAGYEKLNIERKENVRIEERQMECSLKMSKHYTNLIDKVWFLWATGNSSLMSPDNILQELSYPPERYCFNLSAHIEKQFRKGSSLAWHYEIFSTSPIEDVLVLKIKEIDAKIAKLKENYDLSKFMQETIIPRLVAERISQANKLAA